MTTIETDIFYRDAAESADAYVRQQCRLDLSLPNLPDQPARGFPLLVWFHGGGLTGCTRHDAKTTVARFAENGLAVANADYRLGPIVPYPVYLEDAARVVAWAVTEGVRRGANPGAIFVGGHSAGAYLAAMLAMDGNYLRSAGVSDGSIAGYLPISGQLTTHFHVRSERGVPAERLLIDDAAPLYYARESIPPMLLMVGDNDLPARREEAALFVAVMCGIKNSTTTSLLVVPGRDHNTVHENLLTPGDPGGAALLAFIEKHSAPM